MHNQPSYQKPYRASRASFALGQHKCVQVYALVHAVQHIHVSEYSRLYALTCTCTAQPAGLAKITSLDKALKFCLRTEL